MTRLRIARRVPASRVRPFLIRVDDYKVIEDVELAGLFRLTLRELYGLLGPKVWTFTSADSLQLPNGTASGPSRPSLVFTQTEVLAVASIVASLLRNETLLEIGLDIVHAMNTKRRSSKHRRRPARRADDSTKAQKYREAVKRMDELVRARLRAEAKKFFGD